MSRLWAWFMAWWDAEDRAQDVKLLAFFLVVVASIVWLSVDLRRGITGPWVEAFMWLLIAVSLGGAGWEMVARWKGGRGAREQAKAPGTPDKGGQP